jgi:hypothetical protein
MVSVKNAQLILGLILANYHVLHVVHLNHMLLKAPINVIIVQEVKYQMWLIKINAYPVVRESIHPVFGLVLIVLLALIPQYLTIVAHHVLLGNQVRVLVQLQQINVLIANQVSIQN